MPKCAINGVLIVLLIVTLQWSPPARAQEIPKQTSEFVSTCAARGPTAKIWKSEGEAFSCLDLIESILDWFSFDVDKEACRKVYKAIVGEGPEQRKIWQEIFDWLRTRKGSSSNIIEDDVEAAVATLYGCRVGRDPL